MSFFEKRPLGLILCILLGGFSLFSLFGGIAKIIVAIASALLFILLACSARKIGLFPMVLSLVLLISFGLSVLYFDFYFPIRNENEEPVRVEGRITSIIYDEPFGSQITIKTDEISDRSFQRASLIVSFVSDADFKISDKISFYGTIEELEDTDIGFNEKRYYEARGIQGIVRDPENLLIEENRRFSLMSLIAKTRDGLNDYIISSADEDTAGMLIALITGEKSALPGQIRLDFKRIGLSHVLAISGMHLAILVTGLHFLLSAIGLEKKLRSIVAMIFVVLYMGLTGFSVSVFRAGLMLLISNTLFLFAKTRDSFTNLLISVTVICLISPYAVHDISLLLSFFATIGVLAAVQIIEERPYSTSVFKKLGVAVLASVLSSVLAISMTLPFSVFDFGRLSYAAPVTTLILTLLIEVFMYFGSIFLLVGAPKFLLAPVSLLCDLIKNLAATFAELPNVYIIAQTPLIKIVTVVFYLLLCCFFILRIRHQKIAMLALLSIFCSIFVIGYISTDAVLREDRIVYHSDTVENEAIFALHNGKATAVNLTKNTSLSRGFFYYWMEQEKILSLDNLWFPQYTANMPRAIPEIISTIPVEKIYLPLPKNESEQILLSEIDKALSGFRCTYETLEEQASKADEKLKLYSVYRAPSEDGFLAAVSLQMEGEYYTYVSKGAIEEKNTDLINYVMSVSRGVIFGCRGRSYRQEYCLEFSSEHTDVLIVSSDDVVISESVYAEYEKRARILYKPKQSLLTE